MKTPAVLLLSVLVTLIWHHARADGEDGYEYYDESECDHSSFVCDYDNPSNFYRCIDGVFHEFKCPSGLHFSKSTQTCDWPHLADCAGGEGHGSDSGEDWGDHDEKSSSSSEHEWTSSSHENSAEHSGYDWKDQSHGHSQIEVVDVKVAGHGEVPWVSAAAAAGKSWWRPPGLDPSQWEAGIKKPEFLPHVPDEKEEKKEGDSSASKSTENGKKKAKPAKSSTGSSASKSSDIDRKQSSSLQSGGGDCSSDCQLPSCFCAGTSIPKGLAPSSTPQMVMLTFDDEVSPAYYGYYQRLFRPGRYNPNGCPVRGCLFVSGSGTVYDLVYPLYAMGVEIASHTVSHRFPHTWWASASYQEFMEEAGGMKDNLVNQAGIPRDQIKGFRVPFLQLGSDNMYSALYDNKFVYDTSMFTGTQFEGGDPVWPFTLDYVPSNTYCQHGPCPTKQYPGMWEIPVQRWYGLDGHSCAMADGCSSMGDAEETLEYLKSNFRRYYNSNRAPFGIFVHARWFQTEHNLDGLDRFIDYLLTLDDVYIVKPSQVIEWMKNPTPLSNIHGFQPWGCEGGAGDV